MGERKMQPRSYTKFCHGSDTSRISWWETGDYSNIIRNAQNVLLPTPFICYWNLHTTNPKIGCRRTIAKSNKNNKSQSHMYGHFKATELYANWINFLNFSLTRKFAGFATHLLYKIHHITIYHLESILKVKIKPNESQYFIEFWYAHDVNWNLYTLQ